MEKAIAFKVVARFKLRKGTKKKVLVDKKHSIMNSRVIFCMLERVLGEVK